MRGTPFSRLVALYAVMKAALPSDHALIAGTYRSRGHGEGCLGNKRSRHCVAMDKRAALKARNKRRSG